MERLSQPDSYELSDYGAVIRRRWRTVVLAGIIGLAAAAVYTVLAPKTYTSTAAIFVTGSTGNDTQIINGRTTGVVDLDTEAQIVQSAGVGQLAKHILKSPLSATALTKAVSVTVPANSQVLRINCAAHTSVGAARCAHAFAQAYLQNRSNETSAQVQTQIAGLQRQLGFLQQKITKLNARIASLPRGSGPRVVATTNLSLARTQVTTVSSSIATLTAQSVNTAGGRIITDAVRPSSPTSPRNALNLPSGLVAGLVVGLVIAFRRDRADMRIRGAREVESLLDLPVLLDLPPDQRRSRLAIFEPRSRTGQAFAELAHSLAATLGQGNHVVLIAPAAAGHAGSVTAANLAAALARTGNEVALVSANLHGSVTPLLFGLGDGPGLADLILDRATVGEVERHPAGVPHLRIIGSGVDGELAADHLDREVTERLLNSLHAVTRYVIFETAPGAYSADVYAFAEFADAAVVAVEVTRTLRAEVEETVRRLDNMGAAVLGAALLPSMVKAALPTPAGPGAAAPPRARDSKRRPEAKAASARQNSEPEAQLVYPLRSTEERWASTAFPRDETEAAAQPQPDEEESSAVQQRPFRPLSDTDSAPADRPPGSIARS